MFLFQKKFPFFKRIEKKPQTNSQVFTYLVGFKKKILTQEEKYAIANTAELIAQLFAEKLVVLNDKQWDGAEKDFWIHQGRKIQTEEFIKYLTDFEKNIEEKPVEPISRQLF